MKSVLVTGCSGYIGSHLCKLLDKDYDVWGLDIQDPQFPLKPNQFLKCNIEHKNIFTRLKDQSFDAIIHLAAKVRVGESKHIPEKYYSTNLIGTINLLKQLQTNNFIFASTGVAEHCSDPYGISKTAAEQCVIELHKESYSIFRFYNVIGSSGFAPTNPDGLMKNLKDCEEFVIFGDDYNTRDGTCIRDYIHVDEVCNALAMAIDDPAETTECLGSGVGYTVQEIITLYKIMNNVNFNVRVGSRRAGDLPETVLSKPSRYMKNLYSIADLLKSC
jgi:UDP-glucose 4-epimerase|tara:strand:+ start:607 stop:1428 length:822 start_codon:yes stop_codon:yes gene_type:complete